MYIVVAFNIAHTQGSRNGHKGQVMEEHVIWKKLDNHEGYSVSSDGRVRNDQSNRIMKPQVNQGGTAFVSLRDSVEKKYVVTSIGILVASAFVSGRTNNESSVLHLDGDLSNNRASNLRWVARWHALAYHKELQTYKSPTRRRIKDDLGRVYEGVIQAAMATGALPSAIEYSVRYNDHINEEAQSLYPNDVFNFSHKVWPSGRIFQTF